LIHLAAHTTTGYRIFMIHEFVIMCRKLQSKVHYGSYQLFVNGMIFINALKEEKDHHIKLYWSFKIACWCYYHTSGM